MTVITLTELLPFFLVLAIVYGALEFSGFTKNRGVITIISLVIAFFAVSSSQAVAFINSAMPYMAGLFILVFFLGFIKSFFKGTKDWTLIIIILILVLVFLSSLGYDLVSNWSPGSWLSNENFFIIIGLVIFVLILYAAYSKKG